MTTLTTFTTKTTSLTKAEADANFAKAAQAKTAAYTAVEGDNRDTIECSGTFDLTLPVAATITAAADTGDYETTIKNTGTGVVSVVRSSTDTIDGYAQYDLHADQSITVKANNADDAWNIVAAYMPPIQGVTAVATGTSVEVFTSIPQWATKIDLSANDLEFSASGSSCALQLGNSGAYLTSGYDGACHTIGTTITTAVSSAGFDIIAFSMSTTAAHFGHVTLTRESASDIWVATSSVRESNSNNAYSGQGIVDVTADLTRIRINSSGFDGSGKVSYLIK